MAAQGNYEGARPLYECSLAVREKVLGPDHPDVASSLNNLAALLDDQVRVDRLEVSNDRRPSVGVEGFGVGWTRVARHSPDEDNPSCGCTGRLRRREAAVRALAGYS